jgi:vacuolar-type H+-ATPase subunit F/Vma7
VALFRMSGIQGMTPASAEDAVAAVEAYLAEPEVGVVLVGSSHAAGMGTAFRGYLQRRSLPMVLRIPDRQDQEGCVEEIRGYLQRTLGIKV